MSRAIENAKYNYDNVVVTMGAISALVQLVTVGCKKEPTGGRAVRYLLYTSIRVRSWDNFVLV